jgi:hypothetical protein
MRMWATERFGSRTQCLLGVVLLVLAAAMQGCFVGSALDTLRDQPTGSVTLGSARLGSRTIAPTVCVSGQRQSFLGADFIDPGQPLAARIFVLPDGVATVRLFDTDRPLEPGVLFRKDDCSRFELSLESNGWLVNDVTDLRITADLDCKLASGETLNARLSAAHCH